MRLAPRVGGDRDGRPLVRLIEFDSYAAVFAGLSVMAMIWRMVFFLRREIARVRQPIELGFHRPQPLGRFGQLVPPVGFVADSFTKQELKEKILKGVPKVEKLDPNGPTPPLHMPGYAGIINDADMELLINYLYSLMPKEQW